MKRKFISRVSAVIITFGILISGTSAVAAADTSLEDYVNSLPTYSGTPVISFEAFTDSPPVTTHRSRNVTTYYYSKKRVEDECCSSDVVETYSNALLIAGFSRINENTFINGGCSVIITESDLHIVISIATH